MQPIIWKEQPGLYAAVIAAGHHVEHTHAGSFADDAQAVQQIIDGYDIAAALASAKAQLSREIMLHAKRLRDLVIETISAGEMASWSIKKAEAERFGVDGTLPEFALLTLESQQRGIPLVDLVAKVRANASRFESAEAAIAGADGRHRDVVAGLVTIEDVANYDYSGGWPEV